MQTATNEQLLTGLKEILRTVPYNGAFVDMPEGASAWLGKAAAFINQWNYLKAVSFTHTGERCRNPHPALRNNAYHEMLTIIHEAISDLELKTSQNISASFNAGEVFDYHKEMRQIIESAKADLFIIDPYIDHSFIDNYAPFIGKAVKARILTKNYLAKLKPVAEQFTKQHGLSFEVKSFDQMHDRFVVIDKAKCFVTGGSLKQGGEKQSFITEIHDLSTRLIDGHEDTWSKAKAEFIT